MIILNFVLANALINILDAIASPCILPLSEGQSVGQWLVVSDLEKAIASPSFASLFNNNSKDCSGK